jgi:hypothetical protein
MDRVEAMALIKSEPAISNFLILMRAKRLVEEGVDRKMSLDEFGELLLDADEGRLDEYFSGSLARNTRLLMKDQTPHRRSHTMAKNDTTDLAVIDAELVDEDPSTGSEIAKTLAVGATTTVAAAVVIIAYHRLKPRVIAAINRRRDNGEPLVVDAVIVEPKKTEKV